MHDAASLLVISPHLDDGVLACGRVLAAHPGSVVLTIFAGSPPSWEGLTEWDALCGFEAGQDVLAARRNEDREALSRLRAAWRWLDAVDHQYRQGCDVDATALSSAISEVVRSVRPPTVMVPLGLSHRDHYLASEISLSAMEEAGVSRWLLYGDVYDLGEPQLVPPRLEELQQRYEISRTHLPLGARLRKLRALKAYRSQLSALGGWPYLALSRWSAPEQLWYCSPRAQEVRNS